MVCVNSSCRHSRTLLSGIQTKNNPGSPLTTHGDDDACERLREWLLSRWMRRPKRGRPGFPLGGPVGVHYNRYTEFCPALLREPGGSFLCAPPFGGAEATNLKQRTGPVRPVACATDASLWSCSRWGLPPAASRPPGVSSYLTVSPLLGLRRAVCFLWHFP